MDQSEERLSWNDTPKYVGLDVRQATTVTAVREESGHVIMRSYVCRTEA